MTDPRETKLAELLIEHSVELKKGEVVLIEAFDIPRSMVTALIRAASDAGGIPIVHWKDNQVQRDLYNIGSPAQIEERMKLIGKIERFQMEQVQAYIGIRGSWNTTEFADIPSEKMQSYQKNVFANVHGKVRVPNTKWVVLRWPTPSMAQQAGMSTDKFEDFYFDVVLVDYARMGEAVKPLVKLMDATDKVHIKGPGETNLQFSIKGIPTVPCSGLRNIPDGECFTAPVKDSIQGVIAFNSQTIYHGTKFENIKLVYKDGKIVDFSSSNNEALAKILDSDDGSRYVGEFSLGFNPKIKNPMCDILFDEKIGGSLHMAVGSAYDDADNSNRSTVHWDMVLIQTPEYGGGEIYFDDRLIRKDGIFVLPELDGLNPGNL